MVSQASIRVFHYDDVELLCWAVSAHLEQVGCRVVSGGRDVAGVLASAPDVLVIEPRAAGGERLLRTLAGEQLALPTVLLTTMSTEQAQAGLGYRFDAMLAKPFNLPELEQTIRQLFRERRLYLVE